jgi:hypothetical protein
LSHPEIPTVKAGYQIYQIESADLGRSERPIATNKPHLGHPPGAIASLNLWYLQGLNILKQLSNLQPWQFQGLLCKTDAKSLALQSAIVESQKIACESASNAELKSAFSSSLERKIVPRAAKARPALSDPPRRRGPISL